MNTPSGLCLVIVLMVSALFNFGCQTSGMTTRLIDVVDEKSGMKVKKITIHSEEDVVERSPNVTAVQRYTDLSPDRWIGSFCLSPDNETLVLEVIERVQDAKGRKRWISNLWATDAEMPKGLRRLTEGIYFDRDGVWTPDGEQLYFASNRAGRSCIWRLATDKPRGLGIVTSVASSDANPQISPDGTVLIYTAHVLPSKTPQLWSLVLDGGLPTQLREGEDPRWSPDGKTVLFSAVDHNTGKKNIWKMEPDGSSPIQITHSTDSNDVHPQYSPDMSNIVFASDRGQSSEGVFNYDIWIITADGSRPRQLTTNGSHDDLPLFLDDGKTLYFRSNRGSKWDLWKLQLAGTDLPPEVEAILK